MKAIVLAATAAMLTGISPASASVLTKGSTYAESCYHHAEAHNFRQSAIDACDNALGVEAITPYDRVGTFVNRGILRMVSGDLGRANRDFDAALALDPRQPEAWLNKGIALMHSGDSRAALSHIDKAIELRTLKPELAYYIRGLANEDMGNLKGAYADLQRARELAPKWREPVLELARYQVRPR